MNIPQTDYERIATDIHSDNSPVGIDAKRTHVTLIYLVEQVNARLDAMEKRLAALESIPSE